MKRIILVCFLIISAFFVNAQSCADRVVAVIEFEIWELDYKIGKNRFNVFMKYTLLSERLKTIKADKGFLYRAYMPGYYTDTLKHFNKIKQYSELIDTSSCCDKMLNDTNIVLLEDAVIQFPNDSIAYTHNFAVYSHLADISLYNDSIESSLYYYKMAENCLDNVEQFIADKYYYDLISFYYKYANLLLSIENHNTVKAKELFEKCMVLAKTYSADSYVSYCKQIVDKYNL
jgi:hypothetical protein